MRRPYRVWIATLLLASCGSTNGVEPSSGEQSTGSEPAEQGSPVSNPRLGAALDFACQVMTEQLADRARQVRVRWARANDRIEASEHAPVLEEALRGGLNDYAGLVEAAAARGVPGFRCDAMELFLALYRSGESDVDPSLAAPFADDIARLCTIAAEAGADVSDAVTRTMRVAERWDLELTNPELLEAISAIAAAPPEERYPALQAAARDAGIPRWRCDAVRDLFLGR